MAQTVMIFERTEKKYILSDSQRLELLERTKDRLTGDTYPFGVLSTLYMDTPDMRVIRASIDASVYKEKLRLRAYGTPTLADTVFLELKKKFKGVVYKRREKMSLEEAYRFLETGIPPRTTQIFSEIQYMMSQNPGIAPRALLSCERDALRGIEEPDLRITFDRKIQYRGEDLHLESGPYGMPVLDGNRCIMEIKTLGAMPLWLSATLDDLGIFPSSFSKYGTAYATYVRDRLFPHPEPDHTKETHYV